MRTLPHKPSSATAERDPADLPTPIRLHGPGHLARRFHRVHVAMMSEALAPFGLIPPWYGMLLAIERRPRSTQRMLAEERGMDPVSAAQVVDELEQNGLVRRRADPNDRRAWRVELTQKGKSRLVQVKPHARLTQQRLLEALSRQEVATLKDLLARVIEAHAAYDRPGAGRRRKTANGLAINSNFAR